MTDRADSIPEWSPEPEDAIGFIRKCVEMSNSAGACVIESVNCTQCGDQTSAVHRFAAKIKCRKCGHEVASAVPGFALPGEVSKYQLQEAIRLVRNAHLDPNVEVCKYLDNTAANAPGIGALMVAYASKEVIRAMNLVEELARVMSGGHKFPRPEVAESGTGSDAGDE